MPHYKRFLKESKEEGEGSKRHEEQELQREAERVAALEKEKKTPRLYANILELSKDHPLRDQIAKINETGEYAAADYTDCVRASEVNPDIFDEMKKEWRARRAARIRRDNRVARGGWGARSSTA